MKSTMLTMGTILIMLPQALIFAEESRGTAPPPPPPQNTTTPPVKPTETKNTDTKNWEDQKVQMQNKSTEMRKAKYAELVARWVDVSLLTPELLDASKTEESKFWDVLRSIQQAGEIKSRKEYLTKLASQGIDTTVFTDAIIADGNLFWELAKKVQIQHPVVSDRPSMTPRVETGSTEDNQTRELDTRKKIIEELKAHSIDTSGFTTEIISNSDAFWKLVQSLKGSYERDHQEKTPIKNQEWVNQNNESRNPIKQDDKGTKNDISRDHARKGKDDNQNNESGNPIKQDDKGTKNDISRDHAGKGKDDNGMMRTDMPPRDQDSTSPKNNQSGLSVKARELFQTRLDKIPSEKKEAILTKLQEVLKKQIETARTKSNKRLTEKLEIMLAIVTDERASLEDTSLVDALLANN